MRLRFSLATVAAGLVAIAVGSAASAETIRVDIARLGFAPAQIAAHVGDTIEWVNADFIAHTATARDKQWDVMIPANGKGRVTLQHAGDIEYYCRFHPAMVGHIKVMP
jgi:plastocyanin